MAETQRVPILVVEDEPSIQRGLCDVLAYHGFEPTGVDSGEEGLRLGLGDGFALVLLDVMLPGMDGFRVCTGLREERQDLPILMLTARGSEDDVVRGFECGADDYVTKPFSVSELVARVKALLRRTGRLESRVEQRFRLGSWEIDPATRTATRGDHDVDLTRREIEMLALFVREAGRIVSRRMLLREVWGFPGADRIETRTVDMHIAKLRKKLDGDAGIQTVRGEGYRLPA